MVWCNRSDFLDSVDDSESKLNGTSISVSSTNQWQAIAVATCRVKAPTERVASVNAELFAICLAIAKATATGCPNIVAITDCFPAAKRVQSHGVCFHATHDSTCPRDIPNYIDIRCPYIVQ